MTAPEISEAEWQSRVVDYAKLNGWRIFHPLPVRRHNGSVATFQQGHKGYPDLSLARDGVVILAELKTDTGALKPEQRAWRDAIGQQWRIWRPKDWPEVKDELARRRGR